MSSYEKELAVATKPRATTAATDFLVPTNAKLIRQVNLAAGWLWVFAGGSVLNLILRYVNAPIGVTVSVFIGDVIFSVGREFGALGVGVALLMDALLVGFVGVLGWQIKQWRTWAIVIGMALLTVDAVLIYFFTTLSGVWPFLLHALAIYFLFAALKPAQILRQRKNNGQA